MRSLDKLISRPGRDVIVAVLLGSPGRLLADEPREQLAELRGVGPPDADGRTG